MEIGIIGLPNSGKSTLFKALTGNDVVINLFPFSTVNPNIGVVHVPDERLEILSKFIKPTKTIPTSIKFIDLAGLVKNAHKGEGLGNKFLSETRRADGLLEVVRCFEEKNVPHVEGNIDPVRDIEIIHIEIALSDFEIVEKNFEKIDHAYRSGNKELKLEFEALSFAKENLKKGVWLNEINYPSEFNEIYKKYNLLTIKPLIIIANVGDEDIFNGESENFKKLKEYSQNKKYKLLKVSLKIELELSEMEEEERKEFLKELNLKERVLDTIIKESYKILDLITFFTYANNIVQAWSIKRGTNVKEAAGKIHSDFEKGFVKAEVFNIEDLKKVNSLNELREKGLIKIEGKEYIVKDGDVIYYKINI
ncbi:MAG: redox-regulated ATPase YchF [Caldisericia bacterium]|jgi:GTP-binding protein YchF|nr:redox-regulated ATPase YchF [Caldisericia bacterium]